MVKTEWVAEGLADDAAFKSLGGDEILKANRALGMKIGSVQKTRFVKKLRDVGCGVDENMIAGFAQDAVHAFGDGVVNAESGKFEGNEGAQQFEDFGWEGVEVEWLMELQNGMI